MADVMDKFWRAPPVTRTYFAITFATSLLVIATVLPYQYIYFSTDRVFKFPIPEVWRAVTCFFMTDGGYAFLFDLYFLWTYGTGLELNSPRFTRPGDFFTYVIFNALIILFLGGYLLGNAFLFHGLLLSFIYTFAQDNRGTKAHFVVIQIPIELLPYATMLLSLLLRGPGRAMLEVTGLLSAHLYDFLTRIYPEFQGGRNWVQTPSVVATWFGAGRGAFEHKAYGTSFRPAETRERQQPSSSSRGWTSAFSSATGGGSAWGSRGSGHRLGGD